MRRTTIQAKLVARRAEKRDDGADQPMVLRGYYAVFDKPYENPWGGTEYIERGAFKECDFSDVVCAFDHDERIMLGRNTSGSLTLGTDAVGAYFEVTLPESRADIYELVERGDVNGCSFVFYIAAGGVDYVDLENDEYERRIRKIAKVIEVGPVIRPAYEDTEVEARSAADATKQLRSKRTAPQADADTLFLNVAIASANSN